jgi:ribonucleoside-diphosphate reductase alpha subunit
MDLSEMKVVKRNNIHEDVSFDKILNRVKKIGKEFNVNINYSQLVMKVIEQLYNGIPTKKIDELTAEQCAALCTQNPDYGTLAGIIVISNHQKSTSSSFKEVVEKLYNFKDINSNESPLISKNLYEVVAKHEFEIEKMIDYKRDYLIDYFGFKTLERAYLFRVNKIIVERPQHMWMRVSIGIHGDNIEKIKETYDLMSQKYFTHATPTLFNAGTPRPQLSSCYLLSMESDSIDGIYNTLKDCAKISKWAGGIGLHIHNIRGTGSHIRGTNGISNGIVPMLRVFNMTARYVDQGGGKRNGSFAIYLEPWHTDIIEFLELRKNHGEEEMRCRDLFLALWTPDLFMERVKSDGNWSLFCPDQCPGLSDCYGDEFNELYAKYEKEGNAVKTMKARSLWFKILDAQMETGTPYILYKDAANKKSNQKNLGVIKSSNLCTEIIEYSSPDETAVCNLASIALNKCVGPSNLNIKTAKIYTKTTCNYCVKAKNLLKLNNILYEEINLDNDEIRQTFYSDLSQKIGKDVNSVPQIYLNEVYVGGYDTLVEELKPVFHYEELHRITKVITENLNKVIDVNYYPTNKTLKSNMLHRPIGIGVQGLADTFFKLDIPFHSEEAIEFNKNIFETIYHGALEKSVELSIERCNELMPLYDYFNGYTSYFNESKEIIEQGQLYNDKINFEDETLNRLYHKTKPISNELFSKTNNKEIKCRNEKLIGSYSSFVGSPTSNGILQFDLWNCETTNRYDWKLLKQQIMGNGIRNSLLLAPMPTASTSQILGNNECFEPLTSNIYTRRTIAGEFVIVNKYLMYDLINIGYWNEDIKNNIIENQGSVQQLSFLSQHLKDKYKIVWEIPMKHLIDMSRDRGAFICQSQSLNLWVEDPDYKTLTSMHFYSYQAGLKTGIYYLRRKPKHTPQQFTIVPEKKEIIEEQEYEICEMCSG